MITVIPPITVRIAEPLDVSFYLNATAQEWAAMMQARYGPDWELDDEANTSPATNITNVKCVEKSNG